MPPEFSKRVMSVKSLKDLEALLAVIKQQGGSDGESDDAELVDDIDAVVEEAVVQHHAAIQSQPPTSELEDDDARELTQGALVMPDADSPDEALQESVPVEFADDGEESESDEEEDVQAVRRSGRKVAPPYALRGSEWIR